MTKFQKGGKGSIEVGEEIYDKLKSKEEEIISSQTKIKEQTDYGFTPNIKDLKQLEKLRKEARSLDPRFNKTPANQNKDGNISLTNVDEKNINQNIS